MNKKWAYGLGVFLCVAVTAATARAGCVGNCGTDTANGVVTLPPGFSSYLFVSTSGGPISGGNLPATFGSPGVSSTNGSTYTTPTFSATAGELINFDFNYVTSDGSGFPDYAWAALLSTDGGTNYLIFSAQTQPSGNTVPGATMPALAAGASLTPPTSAIIPGGPVWAELGGSSGSCWAAGCGYTGWIESEFTGEAADNYVLEFGVSNSNDENYDSGLAFAGVEVGGSPVIPSPEPASIAVTGIAMGALALVRRRRKAA